MKIKEMFIKIIDNIKDKFKRNKKWKLNFYYRSQWVKTIHISENEKPLSKVYVCRILFRKHLFATNYAKVVLLPIRILFNDPIKKEIHIESILYEGVEAE